MVKITNQIYTRKLQHSVIMCHKKIRLNVVLAERQKCTLQEISTCCLGELRILMHRVWAQLLPWNIPVLFYQSPHSSNRVSARAQQQLETEARVKSCPELPSADPTAQITTSQTSPAPLTQQLSYRKCIKQTKNLQWCFRLSFGHDPGSSGCSQAVEITSCTLLICH